MIMGLWNILGTVASGDVTTGIIVATAGGLFFVLEQAVLLAGEDVVAGLDSY